MDRDFLDRESGDLADERPPATHGASAPTAPWHVLWTRSNCEQRVHDALRPKGYELFLPYVDKWSRRGRARRLLRTPLLPGYLFIRNRMDKHSYLDVSKTAGLVRLLGSRWDRLAEVPERQVEALRRVAAADLPRMPHPYLRTGQQVRIIAGPLANVQGLYVRAEPKRGMLVLSIDLLRQSVAVEIDCTLVAAV